MGVPVSQNTLKQSGKAAYFTLLNAAFFTPEYHQPAGIWLCPGRKPKDHASLLLCFGLLSRPAILLAASSYKLKWRSKHEQRSKLS